MVHSARYVGDQWRRVPALVGAAMSSLVLTLLAERVRKAYNKDIAEEVRVAYDVHLCEAGRVAEKESSS